MQKAIPTLLYLWHFSHLSAARPKDEEHHSTWTAPVTSQRKQGDVLRTIQRAGGAAEVLAVGHKASLQRQDADRRKRRTLQSVEPLASNESALAELGLNSSGMVQAPASTNEDAELSDEHSRQADSQSEVHEKSSSGANGREAAHKGHADQTVLDEDLPDEAKPEKSPYQELFGDAADGSTEMTGEGGQELNDVIVDVEEVERLSWKVISRIIKFFNEEAYRHVVMNLIVYFSAVFILMGVYFMWFQHRETPQHQDFRYGLLECCGDFRICLCGLACPALRWADTVSEEKGGFLGFGVAFLMMMGLGMLLLCPLTGAIAWVAIVVVGVWYRQWIREKYGLESNTPSSYIEDALAWCCCAYCALCQEARQVDDEDTTDDNFRAKSFVSY